MCFMPAEALSLFLLLAVCSRCMLGKPPVDIRLNSRLLLTTRSLVATEHTRSSAEQQRLESPQCPRILCE